MYRLVMMLALFLFGLQAQAAGAGITVNDAWALATAPGQDSGMVQFSISSREEAKLLAAATPLAGAVEIHRMTHENGNMQMRAVDFLALPAGKTVDLEKGGYHVMLVRLKQPLRAGESLPLTLTVEFADGHKAAVEVKAMIMAPGAHMHDTMDMGGMHH